ncbi:MAG: zinc-dependent metalloprotease [Acidimicrobiales bacterium]
MNDLSKLLASLGGLGGPGGLGGLMGGDPWASAAHVAAQIANEGSSESNVDPIARLAIEDLARVARLHVEQQPGVGLSPHTSVHVVTKTEWASRSLTAYKPFFSRFGEALGSANEQMLDPADPMSAMFGAMLTSLGPMLVATSAGSMIGHLGITSMGQYDLPVPRSDDVVLIVASTIEARAADWDIPLDELRLWVLIHELTAHAVLRIPHVAKRLDSLLIDFASAFRPDPAALEAEFGDFSDLSQLAELSQKLNDPDKILSLMRSPAHELLVPQLDALVAAILGFVQATVALACEGLLPRHGEIEARVIQLMVDSSPADRFMERLLGLDISQATFDRGRAFIAGIVDRAGDEGLARLWADELDLPTAAEVNAPGLWLARIGLDPDLPEGVLEIPDDLSGLDDL